MLLIMVGVILAVCSGILANRWHRSVGGWVIATMFFGIFAFVILLCLGNKTKEV